MPVNTVGATGPSWFPSFPSFTPAAPSAPARPAPLDSFSTVTPRPDPLAVRAANGGTFPVVDLGHVIAERDRALAVGADVPGRVQDGPTCGLYALGMVMDFWDRADASNLNPLVQSADARRADSHSRTPDTNARLLDVARQRGYTTEGEMFWSNDLAKLAQEFGYQARVTPNVTLQDIHEAVDRGNPALVPFDVDKAGNPGLFNGKRAHWAVIEGHFRKDGEEYLVATHGWTGKEYVWRAQDFMDSVNQVNESDFPGVPKDITGTLRGRMVEVWPG